jgi:hypothetical protein
LEGPVSHNLRLFVILLSISLCHSAHAKRFRNAYVSFELPPNWDCKLEGAEWVCENTYSKKQKEAIIILTAKEVGPSDTIAAYMTHLTTPRTLPGKGGVPTNSKVINVTQRTIGNQLWVEGMHEGSEVTAYFTKYMATIKDRIAILVTFSAHKEHFSKYANDFRSAIESLRVVATGDLLRDHGSGDSPHGTIGAPIGQTLPSFEGGGDMAGPEDESRASKKYTKYLLFALIFAAAGGYLFIRSKKSRKPKKKK